MKAKWQNFTDEQLREIVKRNTSFSAVQRELGYSGGGGSATERLKKVFDEKQIDYSHFKGHAWNKKDEDIYSDFGVTSWAGVKERLFSEREYKCECCGISEWQNKPIKLQIHHIDGDRTNNKRSNLQILCPNCHSQTDNWCSQNNVNKISDEKFLKALLETPNIHSACKELGISPNQNNYIRAKRLMQSDEKVENKEAK